MSDSCRCFDVRARVVMDEPKLSGKLDFSGEIILCSDGEDYKRGYEEGHAKGLADGQKVGYENGYNEGQIDGHKSGYEAGKTEGLTEGYDNGYEKGKTDGYKDGYEEGYSKGYEQGLTDGAKEEQEKRVDITKNGSYVVLPDDNKVLSKVTVEVDVTSGVNLTSCFRTVTFSSAISEITDDIIVHLESVENMLQTFYNLYLYCPKITVYISEKCKNIEQVFRVSSLDTKSSIKEIQIIGDTSNFTKTNQAFANRVSVERIIGDFDFSSCTYATDMFLHCKNLKEFYPKVNTIKLSISFANSPDLTDESIDAIVNGYADMTGQTAPVLTVHPTVKAKIEANSVWSNTLKSKNVTLA